MLKIRGRCISYALITQEVKTCHENLYASRENNIIHCNTDNINTPTVSQEESDGLEGPITLQEALSSIKQIVLISLQPSLFNSFSQTSVHLWFALLTIGSTVAKCRSHKDKGLLFVCISKEEKDKHCLKNWRPITLLNTVYTIASSCIVARLKTVLPKLIGDDQKGF